MIHRTINPVAGCDVPKIDGTNRPEIGLVLKVPSGSGITAARDLIKRVHYQSGKIDGHFIVAFAEREELKTIEPSFVPTWTCGDLALVGTVILKGGMTHGNPKGRRNLAEKRFPAMKIDRLSRDEVVRQLGLALISRVAVEPEFQSYGIGRALVEECRRRAPELVPGSRYVEVMTSQKLNDAQKLLKKENASHDFLQAAGFRLAPIFTKIQGAGRGGRDRRLYYWAPVIR